MGGREGRDCFFCQHRLARVRTRTASDDGPRTLCVCKKHSSLALFCFFDPLSAAGAIFRRRRFWRRRAPKGARAVAAHYDLRGGDRPKTEASERLIWDHDRQKKGGRYQGAPNLRCSVVLFLGRSARAVCGGGTF